MVNISNNFLILKCLILLFIIFIKVIFTNNSDAPAKITNFKCDGNDSWINITTCKIKAHSRTKRTAEIRAFLKKTVKRSIVHFNTFKRYSDWQPWVMSNITVNGCTFLAGKIHPILFIIKKMIMEKTTFNHTCPYPPGPVIISDLDLKGMRFGTLVIPKGEYRLDVIIKERPEVQIASFIFHAEVWEKN